MSKLKNVPGTVTKVYPDNSYGVRFGETHAEFEILNSFQFRNMTPEVGAKVFMTYEYTNNRGLWFATPKEI